MGSKAKKISTFAVQRGILPYTLFGILPAFRTRTEFIPHPMRNIWTLYYRIPESVDTPFLLFLKK